MKKNLETSLNSMTVEEALFIVDDILERSRLTNIQEVVFRQAWEGHTYARISADTSYDPDYIKEVGSEIWRLLSNALGEKVTKNNFQSILSRRSRGMTHSTPKDTPPTTDVQELAVALPKVDSIADESDQSDPFPTLNPSLTLTTSTRQDFGEAVDVSLFYGRQQEIATLETWVVQERCRLIAILGMGGIGKTALSVKLAQQCSNHFDFVIWRSLRNAPPLGDLLIDLIQVLSEQQDVNLPTTVDGQVNRLVEYLRASRCLIILDNTETLLEGKQAVGHYCQGYENYGDLFQRIAEIPHQSCMVLTSREKPHEVASFEGDTLPVRVLQVSGLGSQEGQEIFRAKGLSGTSEDSQTLINLYRGNPLALKIVSTSIRELFDGSISSFLEQGTAVFNGIRGLLDQQFKRLSMLEVQIMYWLAINREPISFLELRSDIGQVTSNAEILESLESLLRRSLIENGSTGFTQQPVVMEYATEQFIRQIHEEILSEKLNLFHSHALIKAQDKDYIRESQTRTILQPLIHKLTGALRTTQELEAKLNCILAQLRSLATTSSLNSNRNCPSYSSSYSGGNLINLFRHLGTNLRGYDFSHLVIWQADLQGLNLQQVNFAYSDLSKSVFSEVLDGVLCVTYSPDGQLLATSNTDGAIRIWRLADSKKILTFPSHLGWTWSICFSPDSQTLVSGGSDQLVKLWSVKTGECLQTYSGHTKWILSVDYSPTGKTVISSSDDNTVRIWDVQTGACLNVLEGHTDWITKAVYSPDGRTLASASHDQTLKVWDVQTGKCLKTLQGHQSMARSVAYSPDGKTLVSGSYDCTVRLWDIATGECLKILEGHTDWIWSVAYSPDGKTLASGGQDKLLKLWDAQTGQCIKTLQGHTNWILSVAFSPDSQTVVSGSYDQVTKLWDVHTGHRLKSLQGHTNWVLSVTFSPDSQTIISGHQDRRVRCWNIASGDCQATFQGHSQWVWCVASNPNGKILATGSHDQTIRLWDVETGQHLNILRGHTKLIWSLDFSPNGSQLASCSDDKTIRIWDTQTGECLHVLEGHTDWVWKVAFDATGFKLASCSDDQTIRVWDTQTGECLKILQGHSSWIRAIACHPTNPWVATGSGDQTIKLWDIETGECIQTFEGHQNGVWAVACSPDGQLIASASDDHTIRIWNIQTEECLQVLQGHSNRIWSIAFSPNGRWIASGSQDETMRLWDAQTGECMQVFQTEKLYAGMNITGAIGLTEAQRVTLKILGAFEQ